MRYTDLLDALARETAAELVRALLLLGALRANSAETGVEGITKLATLDFLLANPMLLKRALEEMARSTRRLVLDDYERNSVSARIAHLSYEPWDFEGRRIVGRLLAMRLVAFAGVETGQLRIFLTPRGVDKAAALRDCPSFERLQSRAILVARNFNLQPDNLQKKMAKVLPELFSLKSTGSSAA